MRHIKAITLDLDDTLWDIGSVIDVAESRLHAWLAERFPRITEQFSVTDMRAVRARMNAEHPELAHDLTELRRRSLRWHAREAGYDEALVEQGFDVYYAARNDVMLFPDVMPALRTMADRYPVVALTNGNADLDTIGLGDYFHQTIAAVAVKACKPHPSMFYAAASAAGCEMHEVLHVGDDPVTDVQGAAAVGATTVWVNRRGHDWAGGDPAPHHEISELGELIELLDNGRVSS